MMELSVETQFWVVLNIMLLALIIILGFKLIRKRTRHVKASPVTLSTFWVSAFDHLAETKGCSEAIIVTFNKILDDFKDYFGLNLSRGSTQKETLAIISLKLPERARYNLMRLYDIYELIRFGGKHAEESSVSEFRETLIKLVSEIRFWREGV